MPCDGDVRGMHKSAAPISPLPACSSGSRHLAVMAVRPEVLLFRVIKVWAFSTGLASQSRPALSLDPFWTARGTYDGVINFRALEHFRVGHMHSFMLVRAELPTQPLVMQPLHGSLHVAQHA